VKPFSTKRHILPVRQMQVMALLYEVYPMPMLVEQIAYEIGISTAHAHALLASMRLAGRAVKCGPALYGCIQP
jgi:DNA-binding IclR family transcriptional regulator